MKTTESPPASHSAGRLALGIGLGALGIAFAAAGFYIGQTDDAPGAALGGLVLLITLVVFGWRTARRGR